MFNWFKGKGRKEAKLANWNIVGLSDFKKIQNPDSVQYVNEDSGQFIYFSILTIQGKGPLAAGSYAKELTATESNGGWELKGTKQHQNELLVCVISVIKQDDIKWAKAFFEAICYQG